MYLTMYSRFFAASMDVYFNYGRRFLSLEYFYATGRQMGLHVTSHISFSRQEYMMYHRCGATLYDH